MPPNEGARDVLHQSLFRRPGYSRLTAWELEYLYLGLGQTGGAFLCRDLSGFRAKDDVVVGFSTISVTNTPRHASMLAAEGLWNGKTAGCLEIDVADDCLFDLANQLLELDGQSLAEEAPIIHAMVQHQFPLEPKDAFGNPMSSSSSGYAASREALDHVTSVGSRAQIFLGTDGLFSPRQWCDTELEFHWWHRESFILRRAVMDGDIRVRWVEDLVPTASQIPVYKSYFQAGEVPPEVLEKTR